MIADRETSRQSSRRSTNPQPYDSTTNIIPKANFVEDFLKFCKDNEVLPLPEFHITGADETFEFVSPNSTMIDNSKPQLKKESDEIYSDSNKKNCDSTKLVTVFNLIYEDRVNLDAPKDLRCRGSTLNSSMLDALHNCVKKFTTLTSLKLQRCSINAFGIVLISEILASESGQNINDLNLDGNPNMKQNYGLLCAPGTSLLHLSLKLCEINDNGVAKIAGNLSHRDEQLHEPKLIVINLANNHISENGGKFIGSMLRTNRSLKSLTLTGNWINDLGAEFIIEQLSAFTLTHEEAVQKRRRNIKRLKLCQEKIDDLSRDALRIQVPDTKLENRDKRTSAGTGNWVSKKRRASSRQVISNSSESSSVNRSTPIIVQSFEKTPESIIPIDTHPLVSDVFPINGTLVCPGNFELQHLNLSYNKISEDTLRRLINCIEKQKEAKTSKGLKYVEVEVDAGEIWNRLFDHRPFIQGEVNYFLREFEERRGDREVERLFTILEYSTELGQSQFDRTEQLGDCHLPSLKANLDVALSMCQRVLEKEDQTKNENKLRLNRESRKAEWQRFINDMSSRCEKVDKTFEEKEEELREFYADLEEKLHISP